MLEVMVRRNRHTNWVTVYVYGFDELAPKAARAALEIAYGNGLRGEVWYKKFDHETGRAEKEFGYRVYPATTRKVYPQW